MDGLTLLDIIWDSNYFTIKLNNLNETIIDENIEFSEKPSRASRTLVDNKLYKKLVDTKNNIPNCTNWDKWVKLVNPHDKIQKLSRYNNNKDFYKYYELIVYYELINKDTQNFSSIHFGSSSYSAVKVLLDFFPNLDWYSENFDTSKNSSTSSLIKMSESDLETYKSKDSDGNPRFFTDIDSITKKMKIITCDITIDTSHDPINQEQLSFRNFYSQIYGALKMQEKNGHLIVKIFDTMTQPTCQIIYYLTNYYDVDIIKPRTSRYSNSEKFLVASNFKGIDDNEILKIGNIFKKWDEKLYCRTLNIEIPEQTKKLLMQYNNNIAENQCNYLDRIFNCSYNDDDSTEKYLSAFQNKKAIDFCRNLNIKIILNENFTCKHNKKKRINVHGLKNCMICINCFSLVL
jgi:hypothetical protein